MYIDLSERVQRDIAHCVLENLEAVLRNMTFDQFCACVYTGFPPDEYLRRKYSTMQDNFFAWWADADKSRRDALIDLLCNVDTNQ